ncbi:uncharacterized protein LOC107620537 [Arachis ipaensis]|uniref:uncharacterized protein LOC107620537 n=1 Tax=Arachis ipaensis TaxID=130454 RepID=UPI0007AF50E6|nr:uncharacterized protein LOC107620537 [Arachis ipaensis]
MYGTERRWKCSGGVNDAAAMGGGAAAVRGGGRGGLVVVGGYGLRGRAPLLYLHSALYPANHLPLTAVTATNRGGALPVSVSATPALSSSPFPFSVFPGSQVPAPFLMSDKGKAIASASKKRKRSKTPTPPPSTNYARNPLNEEEKENQPPTSRRSRARAAVEAAIPSPLTAAPPSSAPEPTYLLVQRLFRFLERERLHVRRRLDRMDQALISLGAELPPLPDSSTSDEQDHQEEDADEPLQRDAPPTAPNTTEIPQTHEEPVPQPQSEPEPIVVPPTDPPV